LQRRPLAFAIKQHGSARPLSLSSIRGTLSNHTHTLGGVSILWLSPDNDDRLGSLSFAFHDPP